jgi:hypothetical protein
MLLEPSRTTFTISERKAKRTASRPVSTVDRGILHFYSILR